MNEYSLLNILMVLFSAVILKTYLEIFKYKKKKKSFATLCMWSIYLALQYWAMITNAANPLVVLLVNILSVCLIGKSMYYLEWVNSLFISGTFYAIWMMIEIVVNNLLHILSINDSTYFFLVGSTVSKLVMFLALHIFRKIYNNHFHFSMPLAYWVRLMLIPLSTFYIIHNTYILTSKTDNTIFFTITTMLLITVNYAAFDLYDKLGEKAEIERKNLAYEQQLDLCNKQAAECELAYQETRRVRHDINKYLFDIQTSLLAGNLSEAKNKIDNLLEHNQIYRKEICRSGNLIIDSLINNKYSVVEKMGIKMNCNVFLPDQISIESSDLCIIIGNLLDNAIDATQQLPQGNRYINLSISLVKSSVLLTIQNSYSGTLKNKKEGFFQSTKPNPSYHGIGLTSVKKSVDKYDGELLITPENNVFQVTVLLYPK
ncbi:MAG: ATP-binding protein [Acetatifactor sp.]